MVHAPSPPLDTSRGRTRTSQSPPSATPPTPHRTAARAPSPSAATPPALALPSPPRPPPKHLHNLHQSAATQHRSRWLPHSLLASSRIDPRGTATQDGEVTKIHAGRRRRHIHALALLSVCFPFNSALVLIWNLLASPHFYFYLFFYDLQRPCVNPLPFFVLIFLHFCFICFFAFLLHLLMVFICFMCCQLPYCPCS